MLQYSNNTRRHRQSAFAALAALIALGAEIAGCGDAGQTTASATGGSSSSSNGDGSGGYGAGQTTASASGQTSSGSTSSGNGGQGAGGVGGAGGHGGGACSGAGSCESGEACVEGVCKAVCQMNTWIDLTGNGHDGTLNGFVSNPWVGDGTPQNPYALTFDGNDDLVNVLPAADALQFADELSLDVWLIPEAPASYYRAVFGVNTPNVYAGYVLALCHLDGYVPNPNSWGWYACPDGNCPYWADTYSDTSASISTQWYHVVGTYSVSTGFARLYVNGVKQKNETKIASPILYSPDNKVTVGNGSAGISGIQGRMSVVRVWSRTLSDAEVGDLFAKDAARFGLASPSPARSVSNAGLALHYEAGPCAP